MRKQKIYIQLFTLLVFSLPLPLFCIDLKAREYLELLNSTEIKVKLRMQKEVKQMLEQSKKEYGNLTAKYKKWLAPKMEELKKEGKEVAKFFYRDEKGNIRFDYQGYLKYLQGKNNRRIEKELKQNKKIYILMSSSVPLEVWREYICQVEELKLNAVFVLRGFIGGIKKGIKPTLHFIQKLIKGWSCKGQTTDVHKVEIDIDPWVFRKYRVSRVPAVIVDGKISYGDYSLEWHLEKLKN